MHGKSSRDLDHCNPGFRLCPKWKGTQTPAPFTPEPSSPSQSSTQPPTIPAPPVDENEAFALHKKGWSDILDRSETDFYCRYAFYTSRVLAVNHPEIYLKSDLIKAQTYPLEISAEMLQKYTIVEVEEIYPEGYPVFSFLDRRNFPLFLTIHSDVRLMTQIDMASAYYVYLSQNKAPIFILYCDNENSYIYSEGQVISMKNLQPVNFIHGNPVLIFNENYVWFPLMGRDDTTKNSTGDLEKIVEEFSTEKVLPELSESEKELINRIKEVTGSIDVSVALQLTEYSWHDDPQKIKYPYKTLHCALMLKLADYLSPIPAYLATLNPQSPPMERIQAVGDEFLNYITRHNYLENHGEETDNTADSSYYTRTAACGPKSFPISVALDFMGIENYVVCGKDIEASGHFWVYVRDYDLLVNNAHVSRQKPFVYEGRFNLIEYIGYKMEGLSFVWWNNRLELIGTLSPAAVVQLLTYVHERYGDELGGVHNIDGHREMIPLQEVIEALEKSNRMFCLYHFLGKCSFINEINVVLLCLS